MAAPYSWDAPLPEGPPDDITLPPEVCDRMKAARAVRIEDKDIFGWKAQEARRKERHDADFEMFGRMNDEAARARTHIEHEQARHRPSPSPTPPPPLQSAPQPQPLPQPQPPSQSVPPPSTSKKRKRSAEDTGLEEYQTVSEPLLSTRPKRQQRGLEVMEGGTCKEETGKCKLADADKQKDYKAEESAWTADNGQKSRITDPNGQELCGAGGPAQVTAKRRTRQAKTSKKRRPRVTANERETRQEQRAGRHL